MTLYAQRISMQLKHFYDKYTEYSDPLTRHYSHLHLDLVFDWFKEFREELMYEAEIKERLWKMAVIECKEQYPGWVKALKDKRLTLTAKELLAAEKIRFFKTYITRHYLLDKLKQGIKIQVTDDETGKKIHALSFVGK
jgi:sensor histidine kinase YesM